ncbi:hypothetical protein GCM10011507_32360 [Edaphobacter acidisoli]|uniref:Activator of Hsp90 ATPase homologue 1/2-like C-terminal domain-containing protein n=1 Tax=Edaphobacter acidisoli TaxID=2040573 RepID=A0A916S2A1_9BACT|nr:SRPBCC domain-containing protein [Edaphobacter acidisoli]GGA78664.1 hypothetical protein GCM10011507_32360 [Edaphobacter acidisoli]
MAAVVEQAEGKGLKLELTRVIKASRERVFDVWTRPEFVRQWFGGEVRPCSRAEADPRAGGTYLFEMTGTTGGSGTDVSTSRVTGRYVTVNPFDLLVFTWCGDWNPTEESLVTVALRDVDGGTEIKLTQERFATEASRDAHRNGWTGPLDKLVRFAETK